MRNILKKLRWVCIPTCVAFTQVGCSFKLRSTHHVPEQLTSINFHSFKKYSELTRALERKFRYHGINTQPEDRNACPSIVVTGDKLERSTLSIFRNSGVAEYELTYEMRYQIRFLKQDPISQVIRIRRQYTDNPDSPLAKSREMKKIAREMRQQAAERILEQIISTYNKTYQTS